MKTSPTQRSLKKLRSEGWTCEITEHWNPFARIRKDLFGFIDLLAMRGDELLAVQTTSAANMSAREQKIRALQSHALWLASPSRRIIIHGWAKRGKRGQRKTWQCVEREIKTADALLVLEAGK